MFGRQSGEGEYIPDRIFCRSKTIKAVDWLLLSSPEIRKTDGYSVGYLPTWRNWVESMRLVNSHQHFNCYHCQTAAELKPSPDQPFLTMSEPHNPSINELCLLGRNRRSTDFETVKLWKGRSGSRLSGNTAGLYLNISFIRLPPMYFLLDGHTFHNSRASKSTDRRYFFVCQKCRSINVKYLVR